MLRLKNDSDSDLQFLLTDFECILSINALFLLEFYCYFVFDE